MKYYIVRFEDRDAETEEDFFSFCKVPSAKLFNFCKSLDGQEVTIMFVGTKEEVDNWVFPAA